MRRILKYIFRLTLVTLLVALLWGGWYINRRGFTREWRQYVNAEFEKHGFSVAINRLTLDPFHGLIARDVEIYDVKGQPRMLAVISQIVLDIDYSHLIHHKPFLNGVDLRNTKLTLPINPSDPASPRILISNLNARVQMPPGLFNLSKADANIYGIHVSVTGRVTNPEDFHFSSGAENKNADLSRVIELIHRIAALKYEADPPQIDIDFKGDAREPDKIFVEATLTGEKIRSENYLLENISTVVSFQNGVVNLKKCVVGDGIGTLDASGRWEAATGFADLQLSSTLDIQKFSHAFNLAPALDEFVFYDSPAVEITAERNAQTTPAFNLTGHAALKNFNYRSVHFDGFIAGFSWDGTRWYGRDIRLTHQSGVLAAKVMQVPGDFRAEIDSTINPNAMRPLFSGKAAEALSDFDFIDPPHVQLSIRGSAPDFDKCTATGQLQLGRASLRHSAMDRAACGILIKDRAVTYQNFKIERGPGVATGSFTYDFAKHEIRLDKIKSTIYPTEIAPWIDNPDMPRYVSPYRFKEHPSLAINGVVQFSGGKNTNLEILVDAPGGMDYTFLRKDLSFSSISARLLFTDGHLQLSNVNGSIFDGRVQGDAGISLERSASNHTANIIAKGVDFQKLTKLYFDYDNSKGQLSGNYTFTIHSDDARTMQGSGQLTVTNGNIFAIPFLGPFTTILNTIVPGMGYDVARKATANYTVADGAIDTKNFLVQGHGFNMLGKGKLFFLDDKMDFNIRINAQGLPGVFLNPVSKFFEYVSDGTLSKPAWRPKRLPNL